MDDIRGIAIPLLLPLLAMTSTDASMAVSIIKKSNYKAGGYAVLRRPLESDRVAACFYPVSPKELPVSQCGGTIFPKK